MIRTLLLLALVALVAGCGNKPRQPDWLINADSAQDRFQRAYLSGRDRVAATEFTRFRTEVTRTGKVDLAARAELTRCAVRVASLDFAPCTGFEPLRAHAGDAERAYADFLAGTVSPQQVKELPEPYRAVAGGASGGKAVRAIKDPLSRVIAAAVMLRTGRADPEVLEAATDAASDQGWRRAVLAWLGAHAMWAERAGQAELAARLRQRIEIAARER